MDATTREGDETMRDDWERASLDGAALDRHITGNYGEDQLERTARKLTPRQIADELAIRFHARVVQCSGGGAEQERRAYAQVALSMRELYNRPRVTRRMLQAVSVWCLTEAGEARRQFADRRARYAATMDECADIIDAQL